MRQSPQHGFTLVELMVTIAVMVILIAIAFPNFQDVIRNNRVATYTNELLAAVALTRNEAMRSKHGATLCAANAGGTGCGAGTDWGQTGWLIWVNNNATDAFDGGDAVVRVQQSNPHIGLIAGGNAIRFDGRGRPESVFALEVRPTDCPAGRDLVRPIEINASGQSKKQKDKSCAE